MPLTKTGRKIMGNMKKEYHGTKKAEQVFYASLNKGTIPEQAVHIPKKRKKK